MKTRYRLMCRGSRGGKFYCLDSATGKRTSLDTTNEDEAEQIVNAKNQALRQPALNLQIARAYLSGTDSGINRRTWQSALQTLVDSKQGANQERWKRAIHDPAIDPTSVANSTRWQSAALPRTSLTSVTSALLSVKRIFP